MATVICTVGLPKSGKTTWAKHYSEQHGIPIVNPDSVRLAIHGQRFVPEAERFVWATTHAMVQALFLAGHEAVIVDATNTTRKRRDEWRSSKWLTLFHVFDTSKEVCIQRAKETNDEQIIPVIERMADQWEPLGDDETNVKPLGSTGSFSEGKVSEDDEGDLRMALAADHKSRIVRIEFGKQVSWLGLPKEQAMAFAKMIATKAGEL